MSAPGWHIFELFVSVSRRWMLRQCCQALLSMLLSAGLTDAALSQLRVRSCLLLASYVVTLTQRTLQGQSNSVA